MLGLLATSACLLAVVYAITPYSAFGPRGQPFLAAVNVRYLIPALCIAVPAIGAAVGTIGPRIRVVAEFAAVVATLQGLHGAYALLDTGRTALAVGLAITLTVSAGVLLWRIRRFAVRQAALVAGLGAGIAVIVLGGYEVQRRLNRDRYAPYDPTFAWIQHHPSSSRIGLTSSDNFFGILPPVWPMFGPRVENHVAFVGRVYHDRLFQPASLTIGCAQFIPVATTWWRSRSGASVHQLPSRSFGGLSKPAFQSSAGARPTSWFASISAIGRRQPQAPGPPMRYRREELTDVWQDLAIPETCPTPGRQAAEARSGARRASAWSQT